MTVLKLSRLMFFINVACYIVGVTAYSSIADSVGVKSMLFWSAFALFASFTGASFVTQRRCNSGFDNEETEQIDKDSAEVSILLFLPAVLIGFEIVSIYGFNTLPHLISWINIAIAGYLGQNLEVIFRKK
jgi:hypothetical protein